MRREMRFFATRVTGKPSLRFSMAQRTTKNASGIYYAGAIVTDPLTFLFTAETEDGKDYVFHKSGNGHKNFQFSNLRIFKQSS